MIADIGLRILDWVLEKNKPKAKIRLLPYHAPS